MWLSELASQGAAAPAAAAENDDDDYAGTPRGAHGEATRLRSRLKVVAGLSSTTAPVMLAATSRCLR